MSQNSINRWRLILGKNSENNLQFDNENLLLVEEALDYLYGRDTSGEMREGGSGKGNLTAVTWLNKARELFKKETMERIEKHAIEKYDLKELLTDKQTLEKLKPSKELLKSIMSFKHMMSKEVLVVAKKIVSEVAEEIAKKMQTEITKSMLGKINKNQSSNIAIYRNFDVKRTIRKNLKNFDKSKGRIIIDKAYFNSNIKRQNKYNIVIAVDESGSMMDSVIHSAIMAGIFANLPILDIKLVIFDTEVVDLSEQLHDPVETLMSVRLGGGTDIAKAVEYCSSLIHTPTKTIFVLVSDLCEGGSVANLYTTSKNMIDSGVKYVALTALDDESNPIFDRQVAKNLAGFGAEVGAMTPGKLADFIGEVIR